MHGTRECATHYLPTDFTFLVYAWLRLEGLHEKLAETVTDAEFLIRELRP
jgi:hypothetical protein